MDTLESYLEKSTFGNDIALALGVVCPQHTARDPVAVSLAATSLQQGSRWPRFVLLTCKGGRLFGGTRDAPCLHLRRCSHGRRDWLRWTRRKLSAPQSSRHVPASAIMPLSLRFNRMRNITNLLVGRPCSTSRAVPLTPHAQVMRQLFERLAALHKVRLSLSRWQRRNHATRAGTCIGLTGMGCYPRWESCIETSNPPTCSSMVRLSLFCRYSAQQRARIARGLHARL